MMEQHPNRVDTQDPAWAALWAKSEPYHPLWKHLLDVAAVSFALPNPLERFGWNKAQTALIVGLHDIGKADAAFQRQAPNLFEQVQQAGFPNPPDPRCRHERITFGFLDKVLGRAGLDPFAASAIARAAVAHHGYWNESPRPVADVYAKAQNALYDLLKRETGVDEFPRNTPANLSAFGMRLAGHIVLCDWIASNERFMTDGRLKDLCDPVSYFERSKEVAREWISGLDFERNREAGQPERVVETPRPIQKVLLDNDIPPGLIIVEAPMGEGKTEAAWILAEKWRRRGFHGMYMALPTMATSDSLYRRYREDYLCRMGRAEDSRLIHGMAWLRDTREPDAAPETGEPGDDENRDLAAAWFRPTRRAMLAAHGVGTVDQAMLAGMNVKFGFLRLYGLADRVLVIDEVHAYDAYMSAIIARLLQWCACLEIPVILLSATLSARQRAAMLEAYGATGGDPGPEAAYPLITGARPGERAWTLSAEASSGRTLGIQTHPGLLGDAKRTAARAMESVEKGGCSCVILNTVRQAQKVFEELKKVPDDEKLLFHARFTAADRERITNRVLELFGKNASKRPKRFILVATQVVEQSLDVDFDSMISEIAPIDLLLQRSGRMHRHRKREENPVLQVLMPESDSLEFGGTGRVYADKPLLRTCAMLASQMEVRLPEDFRRLIERCYGSNEWDQDAVDWEAIRKADREWDKETQILLNQGRQFALCEPSKRLFRPVNNEPTGDDSDDGNGWRAKTRLGANDRTAVLVDPSELERLESGEVRMGEVRALYRKSLKIPVYLPIHAPADGYGKGIEAQGKLRGLILLPLADSGNWQGIDERGNRYEVAYDKRLGLLAGRVQ